MPYKDPEKKRAYQRVYDRQYQEKNHEKYLARQKEYYEKNRKEILIRQKKYRKENLEKESARNKRYRKNNRALTRVRIAARRQGVRERTPPWADHVAIARKYREAREMEAIFGVKFHVDHIIPLHGKNVSGLHVAENLQVLEAETHMKKGIKYE